MNNANCSCQHNDVSCNAMAACSPMTTSVAAKRMRETRRKSAKKAEDITSKMTLAHLIRTSLGFLALPYSGNVGDSMSNDVWRILQGYGLGSRPTSPTRSRRGTTSVHAKVDECQPIEMADHEHGPPADPQVSLSHVVRILS